jgi:hypothetical protein
MDLNRLNPTQYMWIITETNKPLAWFNGNPRILIRRVGIQPRRG